MSTISILFLILTSNFTQLSSIVLFIPCISCTLPKNHANELYDNIIIERAYARVRVPSKRHAHNNRPRLFRLLHTVSAQYHYTGKRPVWLQIRNKGVWLSAHGRLPGTLPGTLRYCYFAIFIVKMSSCRGSWLGIICKYSYT